MICFVDDLGLTAYQAAWDLQNRLAAEVAHGDRPATLLLLEHPHTYTFGRRGQAQNLLWDQKTLEERGVSVYWVDRGGDITYHGPGQLVGYPIMRLPDQDHVGYVRKLEKLLISALFALGLTAYQVSGKTGVWIRCEGHDRNKLAKIASIGVKVDANGVTRHGFALNVDPKMEYFEGIIACGLVGDPLTSLAHFFPIVPGMDLVKREVLHAFAESFGFEIVQTGI